MTADSTVASPAGAPVEAPRLRRRLHFVSGDATCAAWHYPGTNGACVVMAPGLGVPVEPATDRFAGRFQAAGFAVLAFEFRRFGESGGEPRQVARLGDQRADLRAAIAVARDLPGVDPARVAAWGFSLSGGHVLDVASRTPDLAAAILVSANVDGRAATREALRHQTLRALLALTVRGAFDAVAGRFGRAPLLVPLTAEPGTVAVLTSPGARDGDRALNPGRRYPDWPQQLAARSVLGIGLYRPVRRASEVRCPLLVLAYEQDDTALCAPAVRAGRAAPRGEVVRLPGGHYAPYLDGHDEATERQLAFLRRHLVDEPAR